MNYKFIWRLHRCPLREKKDIFRCLEVFLLVRWRFQQCRPSIPALAPQLNVSDSHRLNLTILMIIRLLMDHKFYTNAYLGFLWFLPIFATNWRISKLRKNTFKHTVYNFHISCKKFGIFFKTPFSSISSILPMLKWKPCQSTKLYSNRAL